MADRVIFDIGWVVDKPCVYTMKGHDKASPMSIDPFVEDTLDPSMGALKVFLRLMVLCEN